MSWRCCTWVEQRGRRLLRRLACADRFTPRAAARLCPPATTGVPGGVDHGRPAGPADPRLLHRLVGHLDASGPHRGRLAAGAPGGRGCGCGGACCAAPEALFSTDDSCASRPAARLPAESHVPSPPRLQIVSCWANLLGGLFPLLSAHYGYNPAVTSAPLMTTVVDGSVRRCWREWGPIEWVGAGVHSMRRCSGCGAPS